MRLAARRHVCRDYRSTKVQEYMNEKYIADTGRQSRYKAQKEEEEEGKTRQERKICAAWKEL